jgi:hypothetical protein
MNMDYSKAFELLNQDAEKERNKKAEKAVHDNLYNKGFRDGLAVLDKIRADVENINVWSMRYNPATDKDRKPQIVQKVKEHVIEILDKYIAESEDKE